MSRVKPYGLGKTFIEINLNELPQDIQDGIIKRYRSSHLEYSIDKNTKTIILCCEEIAAWDNENNKLLLKKHTNST